MVKNNSFRTFSSDSYSSELPISMPPLLLTMEQVVMLTLMHLQLQQPLLATGPPQLAMVPLSAGRRE